MRITAYHCSANKRALVRNAHVCLFRPQLLLQTEELER